MTHYAFSIIRFSLFLFPVTFYTLGFSQSVANYATARNTSVPYTSISTTGSAIPAWRYTGTFSQDDNRSFFVPIGFDFWYDGTRYTQLCVSTNGFVDFSNSTDDGGPNTDDFGYANAAFTASGAANATRPALAVFYDDLTAQGGTAALGNSIKYELTGTAPNRILTLEWINMAVYLNTTPSLNFQVKIRERTGVIEYTYGTMTQGTQNFSYTLGINAPAMNAFPTAAQLKTQQTVNSNTFSNTVQNGLVTVPASNSQILFTPPLPANPAGTLTFTAVTQISMTLNWINWATNEVGYVIYNSTDGVNYNFVTQTAANAVSANITGLNPSQTYNWRVYAVTEGALSNPLSGIRATLSAGNKVSNVVNGNWNTAGSWLPSGVPSATDNVTILNGHTITLNTDGNCYFLSVGQGASGTLLLGNNTTSRDLNVNGNLEVRAGGTIMANTASNTTHNINAEGNIVNNGTIDLNTDGNSNARLNFLKDGNQTLSGTGATNDYFAVTVNMGTSLQNIAEVTSTVFTAPNAFLTVTNGIFKLSSSNTFTNTFSAAAITYGQTQGVWINNPNATISYGDDITVDGFLGLSSGVINVGNAANENLVSNGGEVNITGGTMNVAGFYNSTGLNNLANFNMSGGVINLAVSGTTNVVTAPFNITSPGSEINMSNGRIVIQREGGGGGQNLGYRVLNTNNSSITGGTLQIGNAGTPANQIIEIETDRPIGNLLISSANARGQLNLLNLEVLNNVTITTGTLDANSLLLTFGGNWVNNATFTPGTGTVMHNGTGVHALTDPTGETFHHLVIDGTGIFEFNNAVTTNGDLTINSTLDVTAANSLVDVNGNWTNNGNFLSQQGEVRFTGAATQTVVTTTSSDFYDLSINNPAGVNISAGNHSVKSSLTPQAGTMSIGAGSNFTLLSDATTTARIAQASVGTAITGNMTIQRFIAGRAAGYSDMGAPVTTTNFADWDNELQLSYTSNPPFGYPSAYSYSESLWDFVPVTTPTTTILPGRGFEVWLDSYFTWVTFDPTTVSSIGTPYLGSLNISSTITNVNDGWNLIANPYASHISLDAVLAGSSQIGTTIMYYDETISDYSTLTTGSGVTLAPHQGFWVEATGGSPSLTFQESHKTTTLSSSFRSAQQDIFTLRLSNPSSPVKLNSHTAVAFNPLAINETDVFDVTFRGLPHTEAPHIFTLTDETRKNRKRINTLSSDNELYEIPLGIQVGRDAVYKLDILNQGALIAEGIGCAFLVDEVNQVTYDLMEKNDIEIFLTEGLYISRFKLIFQRSGNCTTPVTTKSLDVSFTQQTTRTGNLIIHSENIENLEWTVFNMLGEAVQPWGFVNSGKTQTVELPAAAGMYLVKIRSGNLEKTFKVVVPG